MGRGVPWHRPKHPSNAWYDETTVQRLAASLLIALVGLMAFLPVAMCPCSTRFVPASEAQAVRGQAPERACCPRCLARGAPTPTSSSAPAGAPQRPEPCPCCRMNGQGKWLVAPGSTVRPPVPALVDAFAVVPPAPALLVGVVGTVLARAALPDALAAPPGERRAGVVLQI